MGKVLTQSQVEQYHEEGFIAPIDVMSEAEAAEYLEKLEAAEARYPDQLNAENRNNPHLAFTFLDELVHHPFILDAVEDLLGPDFSLWGSVLFIKEPQTRHFVSWHQDATYMGVEPDNFLTPWLALSHSNRETGCMSMLPGSHKRGIQSHDETFAEDHILTRGQEIQDIDPDSAVDLILAPGQMSIHHAQTVHGSQQNHSQQRRVGYAIQGYVPGDGRQVIGDNLWMPMRGQCNHPDLIELKSPKSDMDDDARRQRERANQNWANILYHGAEKVRAY
ncbi:MAG: phytanoyl-CoA dioxygenase family protein [Pseudomonadota bacterium]